MGVYIGTSELKNAYIGYAWTPGTNTLGYYTFDDQNSSQITDFSGNNRNLTGGTMPTYTLVSGTNYAGNYTNVSSGVAPSGSYGTLNGNLTLLTWVKPTATGSSYISYLGYGNSGSNGQQISIIWGYNSGQIEYYDQYNATLRRITIKSGVTTNNWYLVGFTREGTTLKTYCNGVAGNTGTANVSSLSLSLNLGSSNGGDRFKGQIGAYIVENKVWTVEEISSYYNKTKSAYGL